MKMYRFPTEGMARRFARNARSRGYTAQVNGRTVTVDRVDPQMRLLVQRYVGLPVEGVQRR